MMALLYYPTTILLLLPLTACPSWRALAFSPVPVSPPSRPSLLLATTGQRQHQQPRPTWEFLRQSADDNNDGNDDDSDPQTWDEDRRNNLFQCLLRDLQIEGVPLLECDASQAHTLQAALWTTMAELSDQPPNEAQKVCLVLEGIGMDALRTFVDDFTILKGQERLMNHLPELERFTVSLVGKGAGPAILLETKNTTSSDEEDSVQTKPADISNISPFEESKITAAMKAFIDRLVIGQKVCPYTQNINKAPQGLEELGIQPGPIGYRFCGVQDVCHVLSTFWTCICEMLSVPDEKLSCIVLSMPAVGSLGQGSPEDALAQYDRFSAIAELVSRSLCLYRGDDVFETLHFYPGYDRDSILPVDKPAHGHLPPIGWLKPMLLQNGNIQEAEQLSDKDLALSNYQRRSPYTAVVIKRVSYFEALAGSENQIVDLDLGEGRMEKASGVASYAQNAIKLAGEGEASLRKALDDEVSMGQSFQ